MIKKITKLTLLIAFCLLADSTMAQTPAWIKKGIIKRVRPRTGTFALGDLVGMDLSVKLKKQSGLATIKASITATDKESPQPATKEFEMKIVGETKKGNYKLAAEFNCDKSSPCLFTAKTNPVGHEYKLTITFLDKNGKEIKNKESIILKVEYDNEVFTTKIKVNSISLEGLNYFAPNSSQNEADEIFITKINGVSPQIKFKVEDKNKSKEGRIYPRTIYLNAQTAIDELSSRSSNYEVQAKYNEKTNNYEAAWPDIDSVYLLRLSIQTEPSGKVNNSYEVRTNENGELKIESVSNGTITVKAKKLKINKDDNQDSSYTCPSNLQLEYSGNIEPDRNSIFVLTCTIDISYSNTSSRVNTPNGNLTVEAIVELTNCDGKKIYIGMDAKYNEKTKSYYVSQSLPKCGTTGYKVESITFKAKDKCGYSYTWVRNWQYG